MKIHTSWFTWNRMVATLVTVLCVSIFLVFSPEPEYMVQASLVISALGLIVFGLFGHFYSVNGALIKVFSILSIGVFIIYVSRNIDDKNMLFVIRSGVSGVTISVAIAYLVFVYIKTGKKNLLANGWLLETRVKDIIHESSDNFQNHRVITLGKHPETGEELQFRSGLLAEIPSDKLAVGGIVMVYVDKNKPEKYHMDLSEFQDDGVFL